VSLLIGGTLAYFFLPFQWFVVAVVVLAGVEVFEIWLWLSLRRRKPLFGHEGLVGAAGTLSAADRVRVQGTTYPARVLDGEPGDPVVVEGVEGMRLVVRRADEP
jgi:membrane protein implicated in regulation of membrane protease activity